MLSRNLSTREKWWKMPFRIMLDWVFAVRELTSGNLGNFQAVAQAHWNVLTKKTEMPDQLPKVQLSKLPGVLHESLIVAYFLRKRKTFRQIVKAK